MQFEVHVRMVGGDPGRPTVVFAGTEAEAIEKARTLAGMATSNKYIEIAHHGLTHFMICAHVTRISVVPPSRSS